MTRNMARPRKSKTAKPAAIPPEMMGRRPTPVVPKDSVGGRALVAVVAIMSFLASLTTGAVMLIRASASEWQSDVAREVTIQIRPAPGRDLNAEVERAAAIARNFSTGIAEVRPYSKEESARLLEPWLGTGLALGDLPVPRLIVLKLASDPAPDLAGLRRVLAERIPGASLDDHRGWIDRMRAMATSAIAGGIIVLVLMLTATILSVAFATRSAMAANRAIIEVLHLVGAKDRFIAGQFQRHFLALGLEGGIIGGGAAIVLFALAGFAAGRFAGTAAADQATALFGSFAIGVEGYLALMLQIILIAAVTAVTSRHTVKQTLETI